MIEREISKKIQELVLSFPVVTLTGPRRSGKTTLLKHIFPGMAYVSFETPDVRLLAESDPKGFLDNYPDGLIVDEAQNIPEIFSYIQGFVDKTDKPGQYILSGSQSFLLHGKISQSLAGRTAILRLFPLSYNEMLESGYKNENLENLIYKGFYPEVVRQKRLPADYYPNYIQTYVERDVRQLQNIGNLNTFIRFIKLCAGRIGQLLEYSSLANDAGVAVNTAKSWISVLEASYVVFLLYPHHKNFNKRLVKSPKLYFTDTGLACSLLDIESGSQLFSHYLRGGLFENFILLELMKSRYNQGLRQNIYFWRDHKGHEVDCIIEKGDTLAPVEIKSGKTFTEEYFDGLKYWNKIAENPVENSYLVYGGTKNMSTSNGKLIGWKSLIEIFD